MATSLQEVTDLYLKYAKREPDASGLAYWMKDFGDSVSPEEEKSFLESLYINEPNTKPNGVVYGGPAVYSPPGTAMSSAQALDLMYKSSTGGVNTSDFDKLGGYAAVKAAAEAAGYSATPQFIQSYEVANNIPESAYTKLNKQFIGSEGAARQAQLEADLTSQNAALAAQTRANLAAQSAAADAAYKQQQQAAIDKIIADRKVVAAATRQRSADEFAATQAPTQAQLQAAAQQAEAARAAATATTTTGMSIANAYQQVLGRAPSASEVAYWTTQFGADVDAAELSKFSVAAQPERAAAPTTNNAIRQMYLSVLGREPDASGLQYFADRFGADVDANELGIFKGMATQEINANAARNAGTTATTTGAVQPITRPTTPRQVTSTQLAPASVTNTAITGTPYTNVYTPATMQQNAPTLAQINAATQSANPYQSLMSLTPQRTLSPAYAAQAGQTTANTNLGGFDPKIYNLPVTAAATTGLLNTTGGGGNDGGMGGTGNNTGGGQTGYGSLANLAGEAQRAGFNTIGNFLGGFVPVGAAYNTIDPVTGLAAKGSMTAADIAALTGKFDIGSSVSLGGTGDGGGGYGSGSGPGGSGTGDGGYGPQYKGGLITPRDVKGPNPPGPDDGQASLDIGEYVIRKSAVKKYGANIFEQINAGKIPAQRLKSLLE